MRKTRHSSLAALLDKTLCPVGGRLSPYLHILSISSYTAPNYYGRGIRILMSSKLPELSNMSPRWLDVLFFGLTIERCKDPAQLSDLIIGTVHTHIAAAGVEEVDRANTVRACLGMEPY